MVLGSLAAKDSGIAEHSSLELASPSKTINGQLSETPSCYERCLIFLRRMLERYTHVMCGYHREVPSLRGPLQLLAQRAATYKI